MFIKSSEYLSTHTGQQIDEAIDNMRDYEAELQQKVDKSTTVNGQPLSEDVEITAEDIGALSNETKYGASLNYDSSRGYLDLVDQDGAVLGESQYISTSWGQIKGTLSNQIDLQEALDAETQGIAEINSKIPSQASAENQLADKNFVNSSVATNTAYFIGTFQSVEDLEAYSGTLTNNDYAFVETHDTAGNTYYDRYKYNSSTAQWAFEYELNNSSFTAEQWATITSGLSASDKTQIEVNTTAIASMTLSKLKDIALSNLQDEQLLIYDANSQKWKNISGSISGAIWGQITGTLANQTDLQSALDNKSSVTFVDWTTE